MWPRPTFFYQKRKVDRHVTWPIIISRSYSTFCELLLIQLLWFIYLFIFALMETSVQKWWEPIRFQYSEGQFRKISDADTRDIDINRTLWLQWKGWWVQPFFVHVLRPHRDTVIKLQINHDKNLAAYPHEDRQPAQRLMHMVQFCQTLPDCEQFWLKLWIWCHLPPAIKPYGWGRGWSSRANHFGTIHFGMWNKD